MSKYNLTFIEAVEKCLNKQGFIRGEEFAPGVYVDVNDMDILVLKDKFGKELSQLMISKGVVNQKYKIFKVATDEELDIK